MMNPSHHKILNGRGAQSNPTNRFAKHSYEIDPEFQEYCRLEDEDTHQTRTEYIPVFPKSILTKNSSPDIPFNYSINPYQGCEHGCVYCYARNTHEYWGYSAGADFESKILIKQNAPELLRQTISKKSWEPQMVMLSGNTDCYQPAERTYGISRQLLEVFLEHKHPVGIITKNSLVLRDLDLLKKLNGLNLLRITLSITSLQEETRRLLEPRTSSVNQRLKALDVLTKAGIAVNVNMAPIIPGINNHEVFDLIRTAGELGANSVSYIMVRLNGQIGQIFETWVHKAMPERAEKILSQIKETHGGKLNASEWKNRMKGEGVLAQQVRDMVQLAREKFIQGRVLEPLDLSLFEREPAKGRQMTLF
jgi:DNA repair photolyase